MGIHKSNQTIELSSSDDEQSPIRAIFCLKKRTQNMAKIEENEDCFILEFDPADPPPVLNLKLSGTDNLCDDNDDLSLVSEKGQVACRDYPHPRHLCVKFPFEKTRHTFHCEMCYCYICETSAPCKEWTKGFKHCDATSDSNTIWRMMKDNCKKARLEFQ